MTHTKALKLALEALELHLAHHEHGCVYLDPAITAIKEALAQPAQEPVAYLCENAVGHKYFRWKKPPSSYKPIPLYTAPPQREWVGLTDEEIDEGIRQSWVSKQAWESAVWWASEKLKEKNE